MRFWEIVDNHRFTDELIKIAINEQIQAEEDEEAADEVLAAAQAALAAAQADYNKAAARSAMASDLLNVAVRRWALNNNVQIEKE